MRVSVFGGSSPDPGSQAYLEAQQLGKLLGEAGYTVLTGGYIGTMEAVSRGAAEAGGEVIGVTCEEIETWRSISANQWVQIEERFATLRERIFYLVEACDAALALPGGPGTLAEIMLMWNQMQTKALPKRPLILIGAGWEKTFTEFYKAQDSYISPQARELLNFAPDAAQAENLLKRLAQS